MTRDTAIPERLRRAEKSLAEADHLLQRRRTELGGAGGADFEDRLLQGMRELAAVIRDLVAEGGGMAGVSDSHAAELEQAAIALDHPGNSTKRA
ncbi:MAG TPA: hypothetical protein VIL85_03700 [Thermomicrobiales bacterium]|jgi:hypothetical protein